VVVQRILAVLTAVFLVGSIAIGSLTDPGLPLGQLLFELNPRLLDFFHVTLRESAPAWAWNWVVLPVLVRPAWLLPACMGVICCGLCLTLASRASEPRSRRKRS
jgi:hypothetical protein